MTNKASKNTGRTFTRTSITLTLLLATAAGGTTALGQMNIPQPPNVPANGTGTLQNTPRDQKSETESTLDADAIRVDENNIVDLHVNDEELATVLQMLSLQSQKNIIASKNVSARVTANLYGVTFDQAMDSILHVNGYTWVPQGNFIYVYTIEEAKTLEDMQRQRVSKVITLNYLNATDAAEFVKPLLSAAGPGGPGGEIKVNGKTSTVPSMGDTPVGNEEYAHHSMLVVYDYEENVTEIENLVRQIDTRPSQVLVEATILQTDLTENNAFGVDFSLIAGFDFADFVNIGGPIQATNALLTGRSNGAVFPNDAEGRSVTSTVGNTTGPGGLKVGIVANDVAVFLRVLDEVTDTTIISNPKVMALNRQASRVLVGRKVGYISTTSTDTATTQTVQFLDTGTQLYFRPFVSNDGMVRMELKPQVSEAVIREVNDSTGSAITIPDEITNELITNVMVRDGQTIVLGGLFRESTESARRQVPILGDIPIVGQAFRGHDDEIKRNEIIFMITPTVVNDTALASAADKARTYVDHARTGAREGTLWFSRDRLTSRLNMSAEDAAAAGNNDKAQWYTRRSLAMNSHQPEVIDMRERLSGKATRWPHRSMLERIVSKEAGLSATLPTTNTPNANVTFNTNTTTNGETNNTFNNETNNTSSTEFNADSSWSSTENSLSEPSSPSTTNDVNTDTNTETQTNVDPSIEPVVEPIEPQAYNSNSLDTTTMASTYTASEVATPPIQDPASTEFQFSSITTDSSQTNSFTPQPENTSNGTIAFSNDSSTTSSSYAQQWLGQNGVTGRFMGLFAKSYRKNIPASRTVTSVNETTQDSGK